MHSAADHPQVTAFALSFESLIANDAVKHRVGD